MVRRIIGAGVVCIIALGGLAVLVDTLAAMRAEHSFSRALLTSPRLTYDPEVTISGFPFTSHARAGEFGGAVITARGAAVDCPPVGGCHAEMGATLGSMAVPDGFEIQASDLIHTSSVAAYTRLDSVNLGRMLGILDLTVNTPAPADRPGGGGPGDGLLRRTSGVLLTGTVALAPLDLASDVPASASAYPGPTATVSVEVDLSVVDGRLQLTATDFYRGPEDHVEPGVADDQRDYVLSRFSTALPPMPMPWDIAPTGATSEGSDVLLTGEAGPRDLRPDEF
ncbi:LmeA family phospholipid-binding protein [Gordonia mangrovi]|nr:DUF2993 domain-containing protein [Gordonia mangrovi]UVF76838.1 LmeA family phospholipid-binding protein [Gordonia mangrovi]